MKNLIITGSSLSIYDVVNVSRYGQKVELHPDARKRINECRAMLEKKIEAREVMYGTNTGIGELASVLLSDQQTREFQRYLIYNHAAGIGEPCPVEHVRAAMVSRVNVHSRGFSGCRPEIPLAYVAMLNRGVTPVVCSKGSAALSGAQ
jgi:histidine ammonia-lyase